MATSFMNSIFSRFITEKKTTASSAKEYIRRLVIANCEKPFDSLAFLKDKEKVLGCLKKYKLNTKKSIFAAIVSVSKLVGDDKLAKLYYDDMMNSVTPPSNDKTDTQKQNWLDWEDIMKIKNDLYKNMDSWETRLRYLLVCLYTDIPPRRNIDYIHMDVVPKYHDGMSKDKNYFSIADNRMIFNVYKTSKKYGQQKLDITPELKVALDSYLKHHPLKKQKQYPLLTNTYGQEYKTSGAITVMLNRIFHKKIGASMLRHIYLSHRYGDQLKEMKTDSEAMAHSLNEQREYIKE
jgi:integrase